jgi:hypothetical protein
MAAAARQWPRHHAVMLMKDEDVVLGMAREVARLPEAEQIPAIRRLALERLGRTMNAYAPENVPDRPYAEFARDPGPGAGASTPEARALASGYSLERGQAFYAWQTELIPSPVVPQSGHRHIENRTTASRQPSMNIAPVTAMPYAAARFEELPNPSTSRMTATMSTQLTAGM